MITVGKNYVSHKASQFTESVIREMTRVALQYGGVNLAQGFPDFCCPVELKRAACEAIRKVHDFLTVGAPAPLQRAGVTAMNFSVSYYEELAKLYIEKRNTILDILDKAGIPYFVPKGAYYVFADISSFGYLSDVEFTKYLIKDMGVAVVPGSSFFANKEAGNKFIRFCFSKKPETLAAAGTRILNGRV